MSASSDTVVNGKGIIRLVEVDKPGRAIVDRIVTGISAALVIFALVYVSNILKPWLFISNIHYVAVALGLTLVLAYLIYPAKRGATRNNIPWYDILLIVTSVVGTGYVVFFEHMWETAIISGRASTEEVVLCLVLSVAILEAARRTIGITISLIAAGFLLYVIFGTSFGLHRIVSLMYFRSIGIFGSIQSITFTIVIMFLLFGAFLQKSYAGQFIIDLALAFTGRWQGGPAKAAVVASAGLGTITGIGPANAAITGAVTIPLMKQCGYRSEFAAAVESVASNGGTVLPPVMGVVVFIMAELLGVTYWTICIAAFIPAILYYLGVFMQVHFESVKLNLRGLPHEQLPSLAPVLKKGWFHLLPVILLVYLLAVVDLPVQHAGMYTALLTLAIILISWQSKKGTRRGPREIMVWLVDSMKETSRVLVGPASAIAATTIIMAAVAASGMGFKMANMLLNVAGGNMLVLLLLVAFVSFVLGMGVPAIVTYLVLATFVAPSLIELGIHPIGAHLFLLYWGCTALITPPVAITVFIAAGIAEANPMRAGLAAVRLGILTFILPFIFVYNPSLLLIGSPMEIILTTATAIIGVVILAGAVEGFLLKRMHWLEIVLFITGAGLLLWPGWQTDIAGVAIIVPTLLWHIRAAKMFPST